MANTINLFSEIHREFKKGNNLKSYVMELDDTNYCIREKFDNKSIIARLFWYKPYNYKNLKLQNLIDKSFFDSDFGFLIKNMFTGKDIDYDDKILKIKIDEPSGEHFGEEKFGKWIFPDGRPSNICVYCGKEFDDKKELLDHVKFNMGNFFINAQKCVKEYFDNYDHNLDDTEIFKNVLKKLFKIYGETNPVLHSQYIKMRIFSFIKKFKSLYP